MWRWLIENESKQFSRAFVYLIFVVVSAVAALALFGILQSTGALTLVWEGSGVKADFAGAFAGFFALLIFLVSRFDAAAKGKSLMLRGNVYTAAGLPAEGVLVFVEGVDRSKSTDATGGFIIEVDDRPEYRVIAQLENRIGETVCAKSAMAKPVRIQLSESPAPERRDLSPYVLVVKGTQGDIQRVAFRDHGVITIGRDSGSDVLLPDYDKSASRNHATIEANGKTLQISDAGSLNGTHVNGQKVAKAELRPGDVIRCGTTELELTAAEGISDQTVALGG